jgi:GR25 family glycosyltransferase involved in LPS biosynthesis
MKVYAITLMGNPQAHKLFDDCVTSGRTHNWNIQAWPAVDGKTLTPGHFSELNLKLNPETKIAHRPGAQGCFLSHWALWHHCIELDQPIVILENDAIINEPIPEFDATKGILKLHRDRGTKISASGTWSKGTHGYIIAPDHARQLIQALKTTQVRPSDKAIGSLFVTWRHSDRDIVTLNLNRGPSTTAHC